MSAGAMAEYRETSVKNPAGAACFMVAIGAACAIISLGRAMENPATQFVQLVRPEMSAVVAHANSVIITVLYCVGLLTFYCAVHFLEMLPDLPGGKLLNKIEPYVVLILAGSMFWLLGAVIWVTGGPMQSWFTPFLLVLIPLLIQLGVRHQVLLMLFFLGVLAVYIPRVFGVVPPCTVDADSKEYIHWSAFFVAMAVLFPTVLQIRNARKTERTKKGAKQNGKT